MIFPLFRRTRPDTISTLYGMIVAQARLPCFYREYTVADTVNGRFELLVLHLTMLLDRLAEDLELREFGQALFDRFCTDMDHNLREMGVGDLSCNAWGGAFYGRAQAYREALAIDGQERLIEALTRNIGSGKGSLDRAATARLAAYMREAVRDLREQPASRFLAGELKLPDPAAIILVEHEADLRLKSMDNAKNPWSVAVAVDDIPDTGLHIEIEMPAEVRSEMAKIAGLRELRRLSAVFDLTRRGRGVHVAGLVRARVGQTCVVTLEPIESDLEEPVDLLFAPASPEIAAAKAEDGGRAANEGEPPEALVDGKLDLGAVATEFLLLGIDPYPRKSGAEFGVVRAGDDTARPFAALEALKKRLGGS